MARERVRIIRPHGGQSSGDPDNPGHYGGAGPGISGDGSQQRYSGEEEGFSRGGSGNDHLYGPEDKPFNPHRFGLRVAMKRIPHLTKRGLLDVPFRFQCPPLETFTRHRAFAFGDYSTLSAGQFDRPDGMQLATVQFRTLIVDYPATYRVWPHTHDPLAMAHQMERICESGTPFYLHVHSPLWNRDEITDSRKKMMMATLRELSVEEVAGEVDARYLDLTFTQHRDPRIANKHRTKKKHHRFVGQDGDRTPGGGRWLIHKGDTLHKIARHVYGDPTLWRMIARHNKIVRSYGPNALLDKHAGRKIHCPEQTNHDETVTFLNRDEQVGV